MIPMDMRKAFKIFNILILIYYGILGIVTIVKALGIGNELGDSAPELTFLTGAATVIALIPILLVIYMAREGLRENYELCAKIALVVVVLDIIGFIMSTDKSFGSVIAIILGMAYVFMAKTAD